MTLRVLSAISIGMLVLLAPRLVAAQQGTMPVVGYLEAVTPSAESVTALRQGLADGGLVDVADRVIE